MQIEIDKTKCVKCGMCITESLRDIDMDKEGYPYLKRTDSPNLSSVEENCPNRAIKVKE